MVAKKKILITGGSGFVGSVFSQLLSVAHTILTPSRIELDCTDKKSVEKYIESQMPDCVIHCAAFTDNTKAEEERGNTGGECYRVNVLGTRNIVDACMRHTVYCVHISTGSVFAGSQLHTRPFTEDDPHTAIEDLSWYGATKAMAEDYVHKKGAILRLSHPLASHGMLMGKHDYLHRMLSLLSEDRLYPLFVDQLFPISDLSSVSNGIRRCIESNVIGTYHMVSTDYVSPYLLCMYAAQSLGMDSSRIRSVVFDDFISHVDMPKRYAKYCAISGVRTSETFSLPAYGWKDVVEKSVRLFGNI